MAHRVKTYSHGGRRKETQRALRSIALKARENLRQTCEIRRRAVALEYATRAFCATKFIANAGERRQNNASQLDRADCRTSVNLRKFIRKVNKNLTRRGILPIISMCKYENFL